MLTVRRVSPNLRGKDEWSPLEIAIQSGFFQLANSLLEDKRTQVNQVNSELRGSALHLAAKSGYLPVCQILLLKGVDLSIRDANGLLAKQVTSNPQVRNLIEKYEEHRARPQAEALVFEEIKEEDEPEEELGAHVHKLDSPKDASGGVGLTALAASMMSGANSPSPHVSPYLSSIEHLQPSHSLIDAIKKQDPGQLASTKAGNRPSTRFELAFQRRLPKSPKATLTAISPREAGPATDSKSVLVPRSATIQIGPS